jgi:hypothetical protein
MTSVALALAGAGTAAFGQVPPPQISAPRPAPPAAGPATPLPPAAIDPTLNVGGNDVKARSVDTRLSVEVRLNGRGPYQFIVDSGADTSAIGLDLARGLQLPLGTPAVIDGMTSRSIVDRVKVDRLTVGSNTVEDLELPALRESDIGGSGLIGIDALAQQRLMMDFEKRLIRVEDARSRFRREPGEIVITARRQRGQLILTHVTAAGYDLDAVIDTGTQVTIGNLALRDKLIRGNRDKFVPLSVVGVTGAQIDVQLARVAELQLGPIVLYNVPIAFADVPPFRLFGLADQPALLLGTDILENFRRISLDFRARKVRFQLRRCSSSFMMSTDQATFVRIASMGDPQICSR